MIFFLKVVVPESFYNANKLVPICLFKPICPKIANFSYGKSWQHCIKTNDIALTTTKSLFFFNFFKHEYLRSRAYICLSLSSSSSSSGDISLK